jgi:hypothetical protein
VAALATGNNGHTRFPFKPRRAPEATERLSASGSPPTDGAALPLSTPEIPTNPPPGTIQPLITLPGSTNIDPTMTVVPTPNASACAESMTMNPATPGAMAPADATGAAAPPAYRLRRDADAESPRCLFRNVPDPARRNRHKLTTDVTTLSRKNCRFRNRLQGAPGARHSLEPTLKTKLLFN